ncbi:hypothetical protein KSE_07100 [Kitasatospora setae KM-6054]|uniref:Uncharacterized protein n=1 Tax=Kitasatospora setae (strain ATCC 33774 / DSM 43861 / JCM 3304 / KCC A-0304 / NBRC 14216 / KM-6054) TaxID=452652 RepID=E4N5R9_KITSK|nr:hypothetical protein KSE_07100 [Kitasatospora setae KM-6054]
MERLGRTWPWRVGGAFAVLWLAAAAVLVWLLFGGQLFALSGVSGPTGSYSVSGCFEAAESTDVSCEGRYTPASPVGAESRPMTLRGAAEQHHPGARRAVREVGGRAYEPSPVTAGEYVAFAGWTASTLGLPALWLLSSARRGRARSGEGYVFAWLGTLFGAGLLGLVLTPLFWLLAVIRG